MGILRCSYFAVLFFEVLFAVDFPFVVLDLAAGTGTSSAPIEAAGARVVACDFSVGMLQQGQRQDPGRVFVAGDALALPFPDEAFDAATIPFGLRNIVDPVAGLK